MNKRILFLVLILKSFDIFGSWIEFKNLFSNFYYNNQNKLESFYGNKVKEHPYITLATGVGLAYGTYKIYNFFSKRFNEKIKKEFRIKEDKKIIKFQEFNDLNYSFDNILKVLFFNNHIPYFIKNLSFEAGKEKKIYEDILNNKEKENFKKINCNFICAQYAFGVSKKSLENRSSELENRSSELENRSSEDECKINFFKKLYEIPRYKEINNLNLKDLL